jgi:predicted transcriptional regulator of viral defense system
VNKVALAVANEILPRSPVFTTNEAAEAAAVGRNVASRDLANLARLGVVTRIARGVWGDTRHPEFSPYAVVPCLIRPPRSGAGYVSLLSALHLHGMIEQIPRVTQVVVGKQRPPVRTPAGTYEFHQIQRTLLAGHTPYRHGGHFRIATPAKALFDTLYLSVRRGRRFSHLPEVFLVRQFSEAELENWIHRIEYQRLRLAVVDRWRRLQGVLDLQD